jgi:hypothetical protein
MSVLIFTWFFLKGQHTIESGDLAEINLRIQQGLDGWSDIVGVIMVFTVAVAMAIMVMVMPRHCKNDDAKQYFSVC